MHSQDRIAIEDMSFDELDQLRERMDLSQNKLCQRGEINPSTYSRWRRWVRGEEGGSKPHPRSLRAVREALRNELSRHGALEA